MSMGLWRRRKGDPDAGSNDKFCALFPVWAVVWGRSGWITGRAAGLGPASSWPELAARRENRPLVDWLIGCANWGMWNAWKTKSRAGRGLQVALAELCGVQSRD